MNSFQPAPAQPTPNNYWRLGIVTIVAIVAAVFAVAVAILLLRPPPEPTGALGCDAENIAWTVPGKLLRGGQPSASGLECLAKNGVDVVVDQRTPAEAGSNYAVQATSAGLEYINLGIPDDTAPSPEVLAQWLDTVNDKLAQGDVVLVHDAGGRGRMGFWEAVYLMAEEGLSPSAAIDGYYVGQQLPFDGAKIGCDDGGQGQVQALAEIAQAISGEAYYPAADEQGTAWADCPRPAYMEGWDYSALF
jgi:hypothetical protein